MNIGAVGKRLAQRRDVGDMRKQPQFDLAVIGADELGSLGRYEGGADFPALLRAERNVLQIRIVR